MASYEELRKAMGDLEDEVVQELISELIKEGRDSAQKTLEACQAGMDIVGKRFETGEYFVGDLIFAGEIMTGSVSLLKPLLAGRGESNLGKMVLCTVKGDIHDIGKNIVKSLLEAGGIEVIDLGVDVDEEQIIAAVKKNDVSVLGLSGVLTLAIEAMKSTVDALDKAGLKNKVKVLIGGAPVTADSALYVGADAWTLNPADGVKICQQWLAEA
jgi:methanogenic corrinoid protein MtbC1